ncbi:hypothetical protein [Nostoc sp. ChiQUE01b]|uniref:hypothetical protein n=1 Tax=Nostoc sp. ChiQUE01b TaxID=3075376 RepID=UPI002AD2BDB9|nr:hypothetical protein [Nostoc sp. ChiQUE01b]
MWILKSLREAIANKSTTSRTPSHMNDRLIKLKKVQRERARMLGMVKASTVNLGLF